MSAKNTNKLNVPEARAAMDKFKMEAANEVGVNLKNGYNGVRHQRKPLCRKRLRRFHHLTIPKFLRVTRSRR